MLSDSQILAAIDRGEILIEPFDRECLQSGSYDVHLSDKILTYTKFPLEVDQENPTEEHIIPKEGMVLYPGILYIGSTVEYTETRNHVPFIEGKSSTGRLGIDIHKTAGVGDNGFSGTWTLEITVTHECRVKAGMPIGQLIYFATGPCLRPYNENPNSKYNGQREPRASMMYRNFTK